MTERSNREFVKSTFDEISPVTGNVSVLTEIQDIGEGVTDLYRFCTESGYHNYKESWKREDIIKLVEKQAPEESIKNKVVDEQGSTWYPVFFFSKTHILMMNSVGKWELFKIDLLPEEQMETGQRTIFLPTEFLREGSNEPETKMMAWSLVSLKETWERDNFQAADEKFNELNINHE